MKKDLVRGLRAAKQGPWTFFFLGSWPPPAWRVRSEKDQTCLECAARRTCLPLTWGCSVTTALSRHAGSTCSAPLKCCWLEPPGGTATEPHGQTDRQNRHAQGAPPQCLWLLLSRPGCWGGGRGGAQIGWACQTGLGRSARGGRAPPDGSVKRGRGGNPVAACAPHTVCRQSPLSPLGCA